MPRFAANLSFLFTEKPFLDRFAAAAAAGFTAVEFMFPYDWDIAEIERRLITNALALVLFNTAEGLWADGERGIAALPGRERDFDAAIERAATYAMALDCRTLHVMSGIASGADARATLIANLQRGADAVREFGIELLIEPINARDMPGYFLTHTTAALDIIEAVARDNVGLQFDLYHRYMTEGDVEAGLAQARARIRHIQIAGPPDRTEPEPSALDCRRLFNLIDASGYAGYIGCEYRPRQGSVEGLHWFARAGVSPGQKL